jgi:hypothetical protein
LARSWCGPWEGGPGECIVQITRASILGLRPIRPVGWVRVRRGAQLCVLRRRSLARARTSCGLDTVCGGLCLTGSLYSTRIDILDGSGAFFGKSFTAVCPFARSFPLIGDHIHAAPSDTIRIPRGRLILLGNNQGEFLFCSVRISEGSMRL